MVTRISSLFVPVLVIWLNMPVKFLVFPLLISIYSFYMYNISFFLSMHINFLKILFRNGLLITDLIFWVRSTQGASAKYMAEEEARIKLILRIWHGFDCYLYGSALLCQNKTKAMYFFNSHSAWLGGIYNQEDKRAKVVISQLQVFGFWFISFGIIFIVVYTSEQLN